MGLILWLVMKPIRVKSSVQEVLDIIRVSSYALLASSEMDPGREDKPPDLPRHTPNIPGGKGFQHPAASARRGRPAQKANIQRVWQTWAVLSRLLSHDAVAVHSVQLNLCSWKAFVAQRARHAVSSCGTALSQSPASIFVFTGLRKERKSRQLVVLVLFLVAAVLCAVW